MPYIDTAPEPSEAVAWEPSRRGSACMPFCGIIHFVKTTRDKGQGPRPLELTWLGLRDRSQSEGCCPLRPLLLWFCPHLPLNETVTMMQTDLPWPEINHLSISAIPLTQRGHSVLPPEERHAVKLRALVCHFTQLLERMSVMRMCVILFPLICCWLWGMWLDYIQSHICRGMFSSSYGKQKASNLCYCCSICNRPLTLMHRFFSLPKRNHSLTFCITAHCSVHTIATSKSDVVAG